MVIPATLSKSPAVTFPGPTLYKLSLASKLGSRESTLITTCLIFKTIAMQSSTTPLMVENSCSTPSILILTIAAPGIEARSTRLKALPIVKP